MTYMRLFSVFGKWFFEKYLCHFASFDQRGRGGAGMRQSTWTNSTHSHTRKTPSPAEPQRQPQPFFPLLNLATAPLFPTPFLCTLSHPFFLSTQAQKGCLKWKYKGHPLLPQLPSPLLSSHHEHDLSLTDRCLAELHTDWPTRDGL